MFRKNQTSSLSREERKKLHEEYFNDPKLLKAGEEVAWLINNLYGPFENSGNAPTTKE